jgi:hypothetical protein
MKSNHSTTTIPKHFTREVKDISELIKSISKEQGITDMHIKKITRQTLSFEFLQLTHFPVCLFLSITPWTYNSHLGMLTRCIMVLHISVGPKSLGAPVTFHILFGWFDEHGFNDVLFLVCMELFEVLDDVGLPTREKWNSSSEKIVII